MEQEKKVEVKGGAIDTDVLQIMKEEDVLKAISDDTQIKRVILNCACEIYGEIKAMNSAFEELMKIVSVCSADKLTGFFKEVQKNVADETARLNVQKKIQKSHLKARKCKKSAKIGSKTDKIEEKDIEKAKNDVI